MISYIVASKEQVGSSVLRKPQNPKPVPAPRSVAPNAKREVLACYFFIFVVLMLETSFMKLLKSASMPRWKCALEETQSSRIE